MTARAMTGADPKTPNAARRRPVPWTKLAWVSVRQHRAGLIGAAALLGVFSLYLLIFGLLGNHAYAKVASCHPAGSALCRQLANAFRQDYWGGNSSALQSGGAQTVSSLLLALPVLLGVFLGAPVLARELETGTFRFAWTQGCGRLRWAVAKLVLLAALLTAAAFAFTELFTWYYHPFLVDGQVSRLLPLAFGLLGVAFAAWTLAAFAIAAFTGALFRRTVPAMAVSLIATIVLAIGTATSLRQHYQAAVTVKGWNASTGWVIKQWIAAPDGKALSQGALNGLAQHAPASVQNSPDPNAFQNWLTQQHYTRWTAYQPDGRFWHFQLIEGGWLLVLSAILLAGAIWLVRRRAA
jgi:hypothetical protein